MQAKNARHEVGEGKKEIEVIKHQLEETKKKNCDLDKTELNIQKVHNSSKNTHRTPEGRYRGAKPDPVANGSNPGRKNIIDE